MSAKFSKGETFNHKGRKWKVIEIRGVNKQGNHTAVAESEGGYTEELFFKYPDGTINSAMSAVSGKALQHKKKDAFGSWLDQLGEALADVGDAVFGTAAEATHYLITEVGSAVRSLFNRGKKPQEAARELMQTGKIKSLKRQVKSAPSGFEKIEQKLLQQNKGRGTVGGATNTKGGPGSGPRPGQRRGQHKPGPKGQEQNTPPVPLDYLAAMMSMSGSGAGPKPADKYEDPKTSKSKSMDPTVDELDNAATNDMDTGSDEPFSAQVLRRLHKDTSNLMQEYDGWMKHLEHEGIKKHLQKTLEGMEGALTEVEKMFKNHHKDLDPLDSGLEDDGEVKDFTEDDMEVEDKDVIEDDAFVEDIPGEEEMVGEEVLDEDSIDVGGKEFDPMDDDPAVGADSAEEELPTPDEALAGMEGKALRNKRIKSRLAARRKSWHKGAEDEDKETKGLEDDEETKGLEEDEEEKSLVRRKGVCPGCGKEDCNCKKSLSRRKKELEEEEKRLLRRKKALEDEEKKKSADDDDKEDKSLFKALDDEDEKGCKALDDKEKDSVEEAGKFLKALGDDESELTEEKKMEAHGFHKSIRRMVRKLLERADGSNRYVKAMEEDETEEKALDNDKVDEDTKTLARVSKMMKHLVQEKAFGNPHRTLCKTLGKALDPIIVSMKSIEDDEDVKSFDDIELKDLEEDTEEKSGSELVEPGEMGEKNIVKALARRFANESKAIDEVRDKIKALNGRLL